MIRLLSFLLALWSGAAGAGTVLRIVEPGPADKLRLDHGRMLVLRYLPDAAARKHMRTVPGKLGVIRAVMRVDPPGPGRNDLAEALGVVLGDTFVQDMQFHWVVVEDERGRHLALRYRRSNILLYPLELMGERVRRGERFDALDLYNETAAAVEERLDVAP